MSSAMGALPATQRHTHSALKYAMLGFCAVLHDPFHHDILNINGCLFCGPRHGAPILRDCIDADCPVARRADHREWNERAALCQRGPYAHRLTPPARVRGDPAVGMLRSADGGNMYYAPLGFSNVYALVVRVGCGSSTGST